MAPVTWPAPAPGLVIRYSYLWSREASKGMEEGAKDSPCAVILVVAGEGGRQRVRVLPITHSEPAFQDDALEIPLPVKRRLGLHSGRSWVVVTEANDFVWPGPDIRWAVTGSGDTAAYGYLPPRFFEAIKNRLRSKRGRMIRRSE